MRQRWDSEEPDPRGTPGAPDWARTKTGSTLPYRPRTPSPPGSQAAVSRRERVAAKPCDPNPRGEARPPRRLRPCGSRNGRRSSSASCRGPWGACSSSPPACSSSHICSSWPVAGSVACPSGKDAGDPDSPLLLESGDQDAKSCAAVDSEAGTGGAWVSSRKAVGEGAGPGEGSGGRSRDRGLSLSFGSEVDFGSPPLASLTDDPLHEFAGSSHEEVDKLQA